MRNESREETVQRIFSYTARGIKYDLERMRVAVERVGNPQRSFRSIHVAGTNGKGSACAYADSILRRAGHQTGLYTSPHILDFEERFVVDGKPISADAWLDIFREVEPRIADLKLTFFEIATVLCFEIFRRSGVEWAVLETGMGGRLDATNVVVPQVSIITSIDMDHTEYLGPDLLSIAGEKLGIVKENVPLVMIRPPSLALQRKAREVCEERRSALTFVDLAIAEHLTFLDGRAAFTYDNMTFHLPLAGSAQVLNALCAIKACEQLDMGDRETRRKGIEATFLPCRFQVTRVGDKTVVFDVAHNPGAARILVDTLKATFPGRKVLFVTGVMKDKDIKGILRYLAEVAAGFVFTQPRTERACPASELSAFLSDRHEVSQLVVPAVATAVDAALTSAEGIVCVTGSFYTVGEALSHLGLSANGRHV
jgi:dihydrofolate synthase / folylpolyglutamate synthase